MDSRYTNREKYLDSFNNDELASMIISYTCGCDDCPIESTNCKNIDGFCEDKISKWLGEYSDD